MQDVANRTVLAKGSRVDSPQLKQKVSSNMTNSRDDDRGGSSPDHSPNDDRSDVMNPNNPDYEADQANRSSQDDD
jgi:hypothetical protein